MNERQKRERAKLAERLEGREAPLNPDDFGLPHLSEDVTSNPTTAEITQKPPADVRVVLRCPSCGHEPFWRVIVHGSWVPVALICQQCEYEVDLEEKGLA